MSWDICPGCNSSSDELGSMCASCAAVHDGIIAMGLSIRRLIRAKEVEQLFSTIEDSSPAVASLAYAISVTADEDRRLTLHDKLCKAMDAINDAAEHLAKMALESVGLTHGQIARVRKIFDRGRPFTWNGVQCLWRGVDRHRHQTFKKHYGCVVHDWEYARFVVHTQRQKFSFDDVLREGTHRLRQNVMFSKGILAKEIKPGMFMAARTRITWFVLSVTHDGEWVDVTYMIANPPLGNVRHVTSSYIATDKLFGGGDCVIFTV